MVWWLASRRRRVEAWANLLLAAAVLVAWSHLLLAGRALTLRYLAALDLDHLHLDRVTVLQLTNSTSSD